MSPTVSGELAHFKFGRSIKPHCFDTRNTMLVKFDCLVFVRYPNMFGQHAPSCIIHTRAAHAFGNFTLRKIAVFRSSRKMVATSLFSATYDRSRQHFNTRSTG